MFDAEIPSSSAPALRLTIGQVEAKRTAALLSHETAFDALAAAIAATSAATNGTTDGHQGAYSQLTADIHSRGGRYLKSGEEPRPAYLEHVRRDLDRSIWKFLIDFIGLEKVMDRTEAELFRKSLDDDPPPATVENCLATFNRLAEDSEMIFRRGIALAFSGLDRRFRSHDGFKIGSRVVISYAIDSFGSWNRGREDTIRDVERAFYTVDGGKEQPDRMGGIIGALRTARGPGYGPCAYEAATDYFLVRVFKNGNAHIWFKRDDLVEKVNLLLAEWYGATLGEGADAATPEAARKTGIAPRFGLFETPKKLAARVLSEGSVYTAETWSSRGGETYDRKRILEPSAGRGRIALPCARAGHDVTCIELQPELAADLGRQGLRTLQGDFMDCTPERLGVFDAVLMNPPFDRGRDCEHVLHAFKFLKPGGRLVAIMSARTEYAEDSRTVAFREFLERMRGEMRDLPPGSFAESGTNVNTVIVTLYKPKA